MILRYHLDEYIYGYDSNLLTPKQQQQPRSATQSLHRYLFTVQSLNTVLIASLTSFPTYHSVSLELGHDMRSSSSLSSSCWQMQLLVPMHTSSAGGSSSSSRITCYITYKAIILHQWTSGERGDQNSSLKNNIGIIFQPNISSNPSKGIIPPIAPYQVATCWIRANGTSTVSIT